MTSIIRRPHGTGGVPLSSCAGIYEWLVVKRRHFQADTPPKTQLSRLEHLGLLRHRMMACRHLSPICVNLPSTPVPIASHRPHLRDVTHSLKMIYSPCRGATSGMERDLL
jgi:hypothetical protein